jgi:D-alanyl-lipoteichoic acid acyltransferase DltB (MBOAT superfamily)
LGAIYFAFQIYGDFSGYSDIAIGTARLFGIRLMTNFRTPYFSRDIAEFWRRWHISLSTWFRDYLYIPLGGSRVGKWKAVRNTFIIFLVSGFWHGANWTFVAWGFIHACLFLPLLLLGRNRRNTGDIQGLPSWRELAGMAWTFAAVMVAWVFFRAANVNEALQFLFKMTQTHDRLIGHTPDWRHGAAVLFIVLAAEFVQKWNQFDNLWNRGGMTRVMRWMAYSGVIWLCLKSYTNQSDFIYFQF